MFSAMARVAVFTVKGCMRETEYQAPDTHTEVTLNHYIMGMGMWA